MRAGGPQPLASGEIEDLSANALSPKGDRLIYARSDLATDSDIWVIPIEASDPDHPKAGPSEPFLRTPASETRPAFSHDGRWVAYSSNDTGVMEVYVRPFAMPASENGGMWQISTTGGSAPKWSRPATASRGWH